MNQPPSFSGNERTEAIFGGRGIQRQPEELAHEDLRAPSGLCGKVQADDQDRQPAENKADQPEDAEIDRAELGLPDLPQQIVVAGVGNADVFAGRQGNAHFRRPLYLHLGEDVFDMSPMVQVLLTNQIGIFFQKSQNSIQLPTYRVPEMTMQMALQNPALSARKSPTR